MPTFGTPQAGAYSPPNQGLNVRSVFPGDSLALFDGTEAPAVGLASIDFARAERGSDDAGSTFNISGMPAGMTIDVQDCSPPTGGFASVAAKNAAFTSNGVTLSPDANGNVSWTDIGRSAFYRLYISAYAAGAMPVAVVQR